MCFFLPLMPVKTSDDRSPGQDVAFRLWPQKVQKNLKQTYSQVFYSCVWLGFQPSVRCCFAPPSGRCFAPLSVQNLQGHFRQFFIDLPGLRLDNLVNFHQALVDFSQIWSILNRFWVNFSQFESALSRSYKTKTHEFLTDRKVVKGAQTMKCKLWTETLEFSRLKVPNSRFALHGLAPPQFTVCAPFLHLIHGLCAFFRLLLTPVSTAPFFTSLSVHAVCTSRFTRLRGGAR